MLYWFAERRLHMTEARDVRGLQVILKGWLRAFLCTILGAGIPTRSLLDFVVGSIILYYWFPARHAIIADFWKANVDALPTHVFA